MLSRLFFAVFLFASSDLAWSRDPPKAPQIEPKQQPDSGLKAQKNRDQQTAPSTQPLPGLPEISAEGTDRKGQSKSKEGSEQGTEFWPPLYGYRLKVTDTLLAAITFLLFLATFALWLATRKLVRGSEKTAKRQLRAYIFIHQGEIKLINNDTAIMANITLKNCGATPGYDFKSWTNIRIGTPDEPIFGQRKSPAQISIIGPLSDISAPSQFIPITPDERSSINNGVKKIFVWGEAVYRDAFGTSWTFLFKATNGGLEVTTTENITGRLLWCGWGLNPAWYEENKS